MLADVNPGTARLMLFLLGEAEVVPSGGPSPSALATHPKRLALLVYLVLLGHGRYVTRDRIAGVFWPKADEPHGRGALRQILRGLRDALGADALVHRGTEYVGLAEGVARCDALEFETLLTQGHPAQAMRLYRGELMDGFPFRGTHAWDDWLEGRRAHYRDLATDAAWGLAEEAEGDGDRVAAAHWGKTAVGIAPRNETAFCRLIELLARVGDRSGALRAYRGLEQWLAAEFEVQPSLEMRHCIERLREGSATEPPFPPRRAAGDRRKGEQRMGTAELSGQERRLATKARRSAIDRRRGRDRRAVPSNGDGLQEPGPPRKLRG